MKRDTCKQLLDSGVLQAFASGEVVEAEICGEWTAQEEFLFDAPSDKYRIKPKSAPLTQDDIPRVCYIREPRNKDDHWLVWGVTPTELRYGANNRVTYQHLHDYKWLMSTDRVTWKPCSKVRV